MLHPISSIKQLVNVSLLPLAPFLKSVIIYFVVRSYNFFDSNLISTILKCAPIISLMAFIVFTGFKFTREYRYRQLILIGLVFSCFGDAFLDCKSTNFFIEGVLAFAVAQLCFITAFGWKPLRLLVGVIFYALGGYAVSILLTGSVTGVLAKGVPIYASLLLGMAWRANARVENTTNLPKLLGAVGAIFFLISDSFLSFNMFYSPIKHSDLVVISTYYIAQLGITLTVLDHEVMTMTSKQHVN